MIVGQEQGRTECPGVGLDVVDLDRPDCLAGFGISADDVELAVEFCESKFRVRFQQRCLHAPFSRLRVRARSAARE